VLKPRIEWIESSHCLNVCNILREYEVLNCLEFYFEKREALKCFVVQMGSSVGHSCGEGMRGTEGCPNEGLLQRATSKTWIYH